MAYVARVKEGLPMRWRGRRGSSNVQDRRGRGGLIAGGGIGAVVLTIVALLLGVDPDDVQRSLPGDADFNVAAVVSGSDEALSLRLLALRAMSVAGDPRAGVYLKRMAKELPENPDYLTAQSEY